MVVSARQQEAVASRDLGSNGGVTAPAQGSLWGLWTEGGPQGSRPTCPGGSHLFLHAVRKQHHDAGLDGQGNVPAQILQVGFQGHPIHPEGGGRRQGGGVCRDETDQRPRVLPSLTARVPLDIRKAYRFGQWYHLPPNHPHHRS